MKEFLQFQFLGNTIQTFIEVFATILIALIIKRIISKYLAGLFFGFFTRAGRTFNKHAFLELIVGPLETFIFLFIIIIALDKLHHEMELTKRDLLRISGAVGDQPRRARRGDARRAARPARAGGAALATGVDP